MNVIESQTTVRLSDLSVCEPADALTRDETSDRWQLMSYETCDGEPLSGVMIAAPSYVNAPEVTLPLDASGWHAVSVGFWIPKHDYDGPTTIKVKLDDDPCFVRISEPEPEFGSEPRDGASLLREAPFKTADLTNRRLVFGKVNGAAGRKAYVAYVKLTPLDDDEIKALKADRERTNTRTVEAAIDGISFFRHGYYEKDHLLELVEPFRHSDVGKVTWACCYGDSVNYPSKAGVFMGGDRNDDESRRHAELGQMVDAGIIPQEIVADHVHAMGMKFEAMFRLGIFGRVPPRRWLPANAKGFVETHPECRLAMADGTPVQKASYAFPETREKMLAIIREAVSLFDVDAVSLAFNRGPLFAAYERPVLEDFQREFGGDARDLPLDDPRLARIRSDYLNQFVRDVRRILDEVGTAKDKRLELGVWHEGKTLAERQRSGLDVETWIQEGLLDSVVSSVNNASLDPTIIALAKEHGCRCVPALVCSGGTQHGHRAKLLDKAPLLYPEGADGVALWDADTITATDLWPVMRRMGRGEEFINLSRNSTERPYLALKEVEGCNMETENGRFGLGQAAYSCG